TSIPGSTQALAAPFPSTLAGLAVTSNNPAAVSTAVLDSVHVGTATWPINTSLPTVMGTPAIGSVLTATTRAWQNSPTSYSYSWQRCDAAGVTCAPIPGAAGSSYLVAAADAGSTLEVIVTAANAAGSLTATSARTSAVSTVGTCPATGPTVIWTGGGATPS